MRGHHQPFQNKVVLITGASSGIGAALARVLAPQGASLVLLARRLDRIEALAAELIAAGGKAMASQCDVRNEEQLAATMQTVHQQLGSVDIVIANAGYAVVGEVETLTPADFQRQFDTNIFGVLRTFYATLADLKTTKGQLVLIGSVAGHVSAPQTAAYSMSKFALRALAETLYAELSPYDIAVTLISPGFIATEIRHINNQGIYEAAPTDPVPSWLRMKADVAARLIALAIKNKEREKVITGHGQIAVFLSDTFPGLIQRLFRWHSQKRK